MPSDPCGFKTSLPGWPLALFRIAYGVLFLDMAFQKAPWINYGWLEGFIQKEIANPAFGWYAAFLQHVVVPHFSLFGLQTFVIELALGVALFFGIFTRLAGVGGFLWQVNIALGAFNVPGEWPRACSATGSAFRGSSRPARGPTSPTSASSVACSSSMCSPSQWSCGGAQTIASSSAWCSPSRFCSA